MKQREQGFAAIWTTIVLLFLIGGVALAVDTSGFYRTARLDQNTADLSCLAGVRELPGDTNAALTIASANAMTNFPRFGSATPVITGSTATLTVGANQIVIDAGWAGDARKMRVHVTASEPRTFSRIWGSSNIPVAQEAFCIATPTGAGTGNLPFGAMPGGYSGGLQDCPSNPNPGNCGPLVIPRDDVSGVGPTLINNISQGADRELEDWLGPVSGGTLNCNSVGAGDTCHIVRSDTGVSASHLGQGFIDRLRDDPGAFCTFTYQGNELNCDTPAMILGSAPTPMFGAFGSEPAWWIPSLWGQWNPTSLAVHYWYNGTVQKCDSPRLARVPIITDVMNWDVGDGPGGWPGKKDVKVIGFFDVIVIDPNNSGDFFGSGNLKNSTSIVIWYGPDAACSDGTPIGQLNGATGGGPPAVKLVAA